MTRFYHARFFADTRFTSIGVFVLLVIGFGGIDEAFLLVPVVALIGANQTAFDASYLFMARRYAAALETLINDAMRRKVLIGADLEDRYLVPLQGRRFVGVSFGRDFSWFGWMTTLYTILGLASYVAGLWLGRSFLNDVGGRVYLFTLVALTVLSLIIGWWWFVSGAGQSRLEAVIESEFEKAA